MENKVKERDLFKKACYSKNLQQYYKELINKKILNIQNFNLSDYNNEFVHNKWFVSDICRYCKKIIEEKDFEITITYWGDFWSSCHKDCKNEGEKEESYILQNIDKSCNDCKYFLPHKIRNFNSLRIGKCLKGCIKTQDQLGFNLIGYNLSNGDVIAKSKQCYICNDDCFEHRLKNGNK